jgi:adenylate cyclase
LVDALKGHQLWSEHYDRDFQDLFAVQDEITVKILKAIGVQLTGGQHAFQQDTANIEAWGDMVKAVSLGHKFTKEANLEARSLCEKALKLDPNYAAAWEGLALTYLFEARMGWTDSPADSVRRAMEIAQKEEATGKAGAMYHSMMKTIYLLQGKYDEAIAEGEKAVAMEPNSSYFYEGLAQVLRYAGRPSESIASIKKAMRLDPYYPVGDLVELGAGYYMTGEYSEALTALNTALDRSLKGEFFPLYVHEWLAITYAKLGQMEKARAHANEILKINPKYTVESFRRQTRYKDRAYLDALASLLVKAGLPEK